MSYNSSLLYRLLVPKPIRTKILLSRLKKAIPAFHEASDGYEFDQERKDVVDYVRNHGVRIFPYHFTENYKKEDIQVFHDQEHGMHYVLQEGKRLYFKKKWSVKRIKKSYHDLTLEQDEMSPHRYLSTSFNLDENDVLVDFGAAEGNFTLSVIERIKKAYLFEYDPEWIEALRLTFKPWQDKVEIVPKFVSDKNDDKHCSGDVFFKDKPISFMKIDVDGGERSLLKGFEHTIEMANPMKIALCTYHQHDDELEFSNWLKSKQYNVKPSSGYMIFHYDKKLKAPYIRRALIRATKNV
jgi:precorrin-6B methylase 2